MENYNIFSDCGHGDFATRLDGLADRVGEWLHDELRQGRQPLFARVLLTDIANQEALLRQSPLLTRCLKGVPCSVVQQPPLGGAKAALLVKTDSGEPPFLFDTLRLSDDEVMNFSSYIQTVMLFDKYIELMRQRGLTLEDHCVRTWIYVRDIDTNYDGVVKARNDIFRQRGLTADTHFIASTGIGGRAAGRNVVVAIDFLTFPEATPGNVTYLHAPTHLNPTHEYGVAFERGARVAVPGGSTHYFISGTASINNRGEVVNEGDVQRQTLRLLENIGALLSSGGATMADIRYFTVYLRDIADAPAVEALLQREYPGVPRVVTFAKVCRPAWLVEMECVALTGENCSDRSF